PRRVKRWKAGEKLLDGVRSVECELRVEGLGGTADNASGLRFSARGCRQSALDRLALGFRQRYRLAVAGLGQDGAETKLLHVGGGQGRTRGENRKALQGIAQLAHVSWPGMLFQRRSEVRRPRQDGAAVLFRELLEEIARQ